MLTVTNATEKTLGVEWKYLFGLDFVSITPYQEKKKLVEISYTGTKVYQDVITVQANSQWKMRKGKSQIKEWVDKNQCRKENKHACNVIEYKLWSKKVLNRVFIFQKWKSMSS